VKHSDETTIHTNRAVRAEITPPACNQPKAALFELASAESQGIPLAESQKAVRHHLGECRECADLFASAMFFATTKFEDDDKLLAQLQQAAKDTPPGTNSDALRFSEWIEKLIHDHDLPASRVFKLLDKAGIDELRQADEDSWYVCLQSMRLELEPRVAAAVTRWSHIAARRSAAHLPCALRPEFPDARFPQYLEGWDAAATVLADEMKLDLTDCNQAIAVMTAEF
jgi:hypothetical protein